MRDITIIGEIWDSSGFSAHTKGLAQGLQDVGATVTIECSRPYEKIVNASEKLKKILSTNVIDPVHVLITQPQHSVFRINEGKLKDPILFVVWEGDRVPAFWGPYLNNPALKQIWVPSMHVKTAILNTFPVKTPIFIVPHGVDTTMFYPNVKIAPNFTFFMNKGWARGMDDRGGIQYGNIAFQNEFKPQEIVNLLVKINMHYSPPGWNIQKEMQKIGMTNVQKRIQVIMDDMNQDKLREMYNAANVFLCPTRAEGFGLTMLEAMACGKPVITTSFGGQTDFVNESNGWIVGGKLEDITFDHAYEGHRWLIPNIEELQKVMREAFEQPQTVIKKGIEALRTARKMSWMHSAEKACKAIEQV